MDQNRFIDAFGVLDRFHNALNTVSVDRSEISDPHLLKVHSGNHQRFERLLRAADPLYNARNSVAERIVDLIP